MNHISGVYHGRTTKPSLYALILAPAASGKSVLTYARASAQAYHQALIEASQKDQVAYQAALRRFQVVLAMIKVYLKHVLILFDRLPTPKCPEFNELPNHKQAFLEELSKQFKRKEAVKLGK